MQQLINGLSVGSIYALLGLGVTLIWGVLGILTFAQAQVIVWGAYGAMVAMHWGWPVPLAVLAGIVTSGVLAVLIDAAVLAPLRRRRGSEFSFVVATIGVGLVLQAIVKSRTGAETQGYPREGFPTGSLRIAGQNIPSLQALVLVVSLAVMVLLVWWINHTRQGRELRAVAYSHEIAQLLGINALRSYWTAFFISGGLAAMAGIFISVATTNISYSSGDSLLLIAFSVIILGGMGSVKGAVVGGLVLGVMEVYATVYISSVFREGVAFILILLVLMLRPSGLFGEKDAVRV